MFSESTLQFRVVTDKYGYGHFNVQELYEYHFFVRWYRWRYRMGAGDTTSPDYLLSWKTLKEAEDYIQCETAALVETILQMSSKDQGKIPKNQGKIPKNECKNGY